MNDCIHGENIRPEDETHIGDPMAVCLCCDNYAHPATVEAGLCLICSGQFERDSAGEAYRVRAHK